MLQHSPVYTIGLRGDQATDFARKPADLKAAGMEVVSTNRGGETTFHGPGQLVAYPIVNLRELGVGPRAYVEGLEDVMIKTLGRYGLSARVRGAKALRCTEELHAPDLAPCMLR